MIKFNFIYPWLLLFLIPAVLLTLLPYFKLSKRYRRTRNRIISMVLHLVIMVMAITLLAGMTIDYTIANDGNEIIILVDVSDNIEGKYATTRDKYVDDILYGVKNDLEACKVGIITFGYDQKYVAPLSDNLDGMYQQYIDGELPDTSATNIASALNFAKTKFTEDATWKKIILLTDGRETDESALSVIRSIVSDQNGNMFVDVVNVRAENEEDDAKVVGVELPDYHVKADESCTIKVFVQSNVDMTNVSVELYDNGEVSDGNGDNGVVSVNLFGGEIKEIEFKHKFKSSDDLHKLEVRITDVGNYDENNLYCSYYYITTFDKVLVLESVSGESEALKTLLATATESDPIEYKVDIINVRTTDYSGLPKTVNDFRQYDQVILNNISNADLAVMDDVIYLGDYAAAVERNDPNLNSITETAYKDYTINQIYSYVYEYGGGLFTVGGKDGEGNANAYNRADLKATKYQQILPVQAIDYTPPAGIMVIIDRSGSMGGTRLTAARNGAYAVLDELTERDYMGLMTLDSNFSSVLPMTSVTQKETIRNAIDTIQQAQGGTVFEDALIKASQALVSLKKVAKRHVILLTDGQPAGDKTYLKIVQDYYEAFGITFSVVLVGTTSGQKAMEELCAKAGGEAAGSRCIVAVDTERLPEMLRADVNCPAIKEVSDEPFQPTIYAKMSPLVSGFDKNPMDENKMIANLGGFFGTKLKTGAELILTGEYEVPLYAQWKFGKGMVGSFMCDLNGGVWSAEFMEDKDGKQFIRNVVANLMPVEDIRPNALDFIFKEDNYTNQLTIYGVTTDEQIRGQIVIPDTNDSSADQVILDLNSAIGGDKYYVTVPFSATSNMCSFVFKEPGTYKIIVWKVNSEGAELPNSRLEIYKTFSYSKEYDTMNQDVTQIADIDSKLMTIAERGNGFYVGDGNVLQCLNAEDKPVKNFDPRWLFMILAIICMLLDIAVRKFKFKWIHEIVREKKQQKLQQR